MIVSHKHRFIFIKSQRTGGTSLELALSTICGPDDIVPPLPRHETDRSELGGMSPRNFDVPIHRHRLEDWRLILQGRGRRAFWSHVDARDTRAWLSPRVWKDYFKFAVDRNPWDRAISFYWRLHPDEESRPPMAKFLRDLPQRKISNFSFYAIGNEVVVDHVMRYERLTDEVTALCDRVGIESRLDLPRAKSGTRKDRRPYREVLQPEERAIIAERCSREIDLLGYEF